MFNLNLRGDYSDTWETSGSSSDSRPDSSDDSSDSSASVDEVESRRLPFLILKKSYFDLKVDSFSVPNIRFDEWLPDFFGFFDDFGDGSIRI